MFNPGSLSTPVRIVSNSAMKNENTGLSLNDCMEAGLNSLASLLDVLLKFRGYEQALCFDLSKAYQALKTGEMESNLRMFLWRESPEEE